MERISQCIIFHSARVVGVPGQKAAGWGRDVMIEDNVILMYAAVDQGAEEEVARRYVVGMPEVIRSALIELGWTPPNNDGGEPDGRDGT